MSRDIAVFLMCVFPAIILLTMAANSLYEQYEGYVVFTGIFCSIICFIPWLLNHFHLVHLPYWMIAVILLAIFLHSYGVLVREYDNRTGYDIITHTYSSFVISLCAMFTLFCLQKYNGCIHFTIRVMALLVMFVMISFGVIWEVFEYTVDSLFITHMQYAPWDTIQDMFCNSLGSVLASSFIVFMMRKISIDNFIEKIKLHPWLIKFLAKTDETVKEI